MSTERVVRRLETLLKTQAKYLQSGNLGGALAMAPGIEKLVEKLEADGMPPKSAARSVVNLRDQASRNADLITAARQGVDSAREMLRQIDNTDGFQAYDAQGRATRIGNSG